MNTLNFFLHLESDIMHIILLAAATIAATLMQCSLKELMVTLSTHKIKAGKDTITKKLTLRQVCLLLPKQFLQSIIVQILNVFARRK